MNRMECTLLVLADFSKAFDPVKYGSVVKKMNGLGFQGHTLNGHWTVNYHCVSEHFVQVHDPAITKSVSINFGVAQGSIISPLIFTYMWLICKEN